MFLSSQAPIVSGAKISAIGISPQNDNVRIVGLNNGGLFYTTNGSSTLNDLDPGNLIPNKYVARTVIDPTDQNTAYITLDTYTGGTTASLSHLWKATNLSGTPVLTAINGAGGANGLPDIPVNALTVDTNDPAAPGTSILYIGTDIGVYRSTDGGANWFSLGTGLPLIPVFDMGIQQGARVLRIATHGRGIWEIALDGTPTQTLTVASSNPNTGVSITVSPTDNNGDGNGSTQFTRIYNHNTLVSLTAPDTAGGNTFQKWQRDGVDWSTPVATSVTMGADHTMTAIYLPVVTIAATDPNAAESASDTGTFTVSRTGPTTSSLTVNYTVGGTATNGTDYSTVPGSVTILAGASSAPITVTPVDDAVFEGDETVILTLASGTYIIGAQNSATVTIADNDLPTVMIQATTPTASEAGATTGAFAVSRTGPTTSSLTVNYTVGGTATNGTDYSSLSGSVMIPAGFPSATITITPVDDALVEGSETVILTLASGTGYTIGNPNSATVTITDNDSNGPLAAGPLLLPSGEVGVPYDAPLISGGISPYTFTVIKGLFPSGLSPDSNTGHLKGTPGPSTGGSFVIHVVDAGNSSITTGTFKMKVLGQLTITTTLLKAGTVGKAYKGAFRATGGDKSFHWTELTGHLAGTGLSLSSTGAVIGIPMQSGSFMLKIEVTDGVGGSDERDFTLVIN